MSSEETTYRLKVGQVVPEFELDTYDPKEMFFGKASLEKQKKMENGPFFFSTRRISPLFEPLNLPLWQSVLNNSTK